MKIFCGIPAYQSLVHADVMQGILDLAIEANMRKGDDFSYAVHSSPFLSLNRNRIMHQGLDSDWILMWDADIAVPDGKFFYQMVDTAYKTDAVLVGLQVRIKM